MRICSCSCYRLARRKSSSVGVLPIAFSGLGGATAIETAATVRTKTIVQSQNVRPESPLAKPADRVS